MSSEKPYGTIPPPSLPVFKENNLEVTGIRTQWYKHISLSRLFIFTVTASSLWLFLHGPFREQPPRNTASCPQENALVPTVNRALWEDLGKFYNDTEFKKRAVDWLSGAVRIPTESFDQLGPVGKDPRWEVFKPFHQYLFDSFPKVNSILQLTKVNTYGLLYTWPGSDKTLKPLVLMAHQDVVPVDPSTVDQWIHPPFSGFFDGENVWGRGSSDHKSGLIGILSSVETMLERGFQPTRTIILSFGFDEEISGRRGAGELAKVLLKTYGEDGVAMIVDEGGGFNKHGGTIFATPGVAEKGYFDMSVEVTSPGGHSSLPPVHTSIGILAALLVQYEAHPSEVHLTRQEPLYHMTQCLGAHAANLPQGYRKLITRAKHSDKALYALGRVLFHERANKNLVGSTQAIDLIEGGVKVNALPERAQAVINHRISVTSSVAELRAHAIGILEPLAREFNLTFDAFGRGDGSQASGEMMVPPSDRTLTLRDAFGNIPLEPAPITPTEGPLAAPFQLLSGTIKATYNAHRGLHGDDAAGIVVSPGMMSGNTDTRYYWALTRHIFRYNHGEPGWKNNGLHTVNEHIEIDAFLERIRFFTTLILNAEEATNRM